MADIFCCAFLSRSDGNRTKSILYRRNCQADVMQHVNIREAFTTMQNFQHRTSHKQDANLCIRPSKNLCSRRPQRLKPGLSTTAQPLYVPFGQQTLKLGYFCCRTFFSVTLDGQTKNKGLSKRKSERVLTKIFCIFPHYCINYRTPINSEVIYNFMN